MLKTRFLAGLFVALLVATVCRGAVPEFEIETTSPSLATYAGRLRVWRPDKLEPFAQLIGFSSGGPGVRVLIAHEGSAPAAVPGWVAGYADSAASVIVLLPQRLPVYPDSSLEELLGHELAHVMISRAAGGGALPRWFREGLAMMAEDAWGFSDRSRLVLAMVGNSEGVALAAIDRSFAGSSDEVARAYALSGAFVRDLVRRHGQTVIADLLSRVADGEEFGAAFERVVGETLHTVERSFWRRYGFWYRWLPILTSSTTLWILITGLALVAIKRRRQRDRELRERWEEEERTRFPDPPQAVN